MRGGDLPRDRLVEAATRVLTLRFRLAGTPLPPLSGLSSAAHRRAADGLAASAVTQLRGRCAAAVRGPLTVTASGGRETSRALLERALKSLGVRTRPSGGTVVHLVGYGDGAADLSDGAAVTVAMDTPYLLARSRSGDPPGDVLLVARFADRARPRHRRQGAPDRPVTRTRARFAPYGVLSAPAVLGRGRLIRFAERHGRR